MGADDQQLDLLGALEALGGSAGIGRLRDLLGWYEATYEAVKAPLVAAGQLQSGRGRGGSVSLAGARMATKQSRQDWNPRTGPTGQLLEPRLLSLQPAASPPANRTFRPSSGAWPTCSAVTTSRATTAR